MNEGVRIMARGDKMRVNYDEYLVDDDLHINWYPGHMKKTKELVRDNLKLVDVVVELLDSRIPFSSKNPDIDKLAGDKPRVVILNKSDLSDRAKLDRWIIVYFFVSISREVSNIIYRYFYFFFFYSSFHYTFAHVRVKYIWKESHYMKSHIVS